MDILAKKENLIYSTSKHELYYLNADLGSVFESQVAHYLISLSEKAIFENITLICGIKSPEEQERVNDLFKSKNIQLRFFKSYPNYPFFNLLQRKAIDQVLKTCQKRAEVHFHIRGELLASLACKPIFNQFGTLKNVVVDIRGAGMEELDIYHRAGKLKILLKKWNYLIAFKKLNEFHKISVVSDALKAYIINKSKINPHSIHVIHCLAGENFTYNELKRQETRSKLSIGDDEKLLIFSSGGQAGWQNSKVLSELASDKYLILNMSKDIIKHTRIKSRFVPYKEVPDYLNAADAAIIFRDHNVVNEVACPVKFCEYTCCGLPVISNNSVKEIKEYIQKNNSGVILNHTADIHSIDLSPIYHLNRSAQAIQGQHTYGVDTITQKYFNLYFKQL